MKQMTRKQLITTLRTLTGLQIRDGQKEMNYDQIIEFKGTLMDGTRVKITFKNNGIQEVIYL